MHARTHTHTHTHARTHAHAHARTHTHTHTHTHTRTHTHPTPYTSSFLHIATIPQIPVLYQNYDSVPVYTVPTCQQTRLYPVLSICQSTDDIMCTFCKRQDRPHSHPRASLIPRPGPASFPCQGQPHSHAQSSTTAVIVCSTSYTEKVLCNITHFCSVTLSSIGQNS